MVRLSRKFILPLFSVALAAPFAQATGPDVDPTSVIAESKLFPGYISRQPHEFQRPAPFARYSAFRRPVMFKAPFKAPSAAMQAQLASAAAKAQGIMTECPTWNKDEGPVAYGVYEVPVAGASPNGFTLLKNLNSLAWTFFGCSGAAYSPEGIYIAATDYDKGQIKGRTCYLLDPDTWDVKKQWYVNADDTWVNSSAYDPTSGIVYGHFTHAEVNNNYNFIGTFDVNTGTATVIKKADFEMPLYNMYQVAITSKGQLYGLCTSREDETLGKRALYKIDKSDASVTKIADTGLPTNSQLGMVSVAIDPTDTYMYVYSGGYEMSLGALYAVKLSDGSVTKIYDVPGKEGFKSIYFPVAPGNDCPRAVENLAADFTDDSLTGAISFTMPAKTVAGTSLSGNLNYTVTINGEQSATGSAASGQSVRVPLSVTGSGNQTIAVRASNSAGYSAVATLHKYIGRDVPAPIPSVRVAYSNGTFSLDWDAPASLNGGYFEPSKLKYKVTVYGSDVAAESLSSTRFTYRVTEPDNGFIVYWFRVIPQYDGKEFSGTSSPHVAIGNMQLPYVSDFDGNDNGYCYINANNDHRAWERNWRFGYIGLQGNTYEGSDDWFIVPPVVMETGKAYRIDYNIRAHMPELPEKFSLWVGNDSTVAAMTTLLQPEKILKESDRNHTEHVYYSPKTNGKYHFAVHATSDAQNGTLYIDRVAISAPVSAKLAAEMTDFNLSRAETGELKAILKFTAPATDLAGNPISSIDKIEIARDGEVIAEIPATPGQKVTWEDTTVPENGTYTYTIAAWTSEGRGMEAVRSAFIGVKVPDGIKSITVRRGVDTGHFIIEWDSDPVDISGDPFDESTLNYNLYYTKYGEQTPIAEGIHDKRKVFRVCEPDAEQIITFFGVEPVNTAGTGYGMMSEGIPAGRPDTAPYRESFANKQAHHVYWVDYHPYYYATWLFANDTDFPDVASQDGDGGFLVFGSQEQGNGAGYISGNIDLTGCENPVMSYWYYTWEYGNTVTVKIKEGTEWTEVDSYACNDDYRTNGNKRAWVRRSIDLSAYKGKIIQWQMRGKCVDGLYSLVDNVYIGQSHDVDMMVSPIKAPSRVQGGNRFNIYASVFNLGVKPSPDYKVNLIVDGKVDETIERTSLPEGGTRLEMFRRVINLGDEPAHTYRIEVVAEGDEDTSNNSSDEVTVSRAGTIYPTPESLEVAYSDGGGVALSWHAPDLSGTRRVTVTDDVEDYTDFSIGLPGTEVDDDSTGDWTMIDRDGKYTYTFNGGSFPNAQNKMAFIVFNAPAAGIDTELSSIWRPYSGDKMFASFLPIREKGEDGTETNVDKDDWLVSPLLTGDAQTISFKARTMSPTYALEKFEVYCTSADVPDPDTMVKVGEMCEADYEWDEFSFELPAGTKYFAIRNFGADGFVFLVDDIVYQPGAAAGMGLTLLGYNVYRDNRLISGESPVTGTSYVDAEARDDRRLTYQVTALYDCGESMPATAAIGEDGIEGVGVAAVKIYGGEGCILVEGASGLPLTVATPDGVVRRSIACGAALTRIPAAPGIYIVRAGRSSFKVAVK